MQRVHVMNALPCLLEDVSRLECQAAKTKRAGLRLQGYLAPMLAEGAEPHQATPL